MLHVAGLDEHGLHVIDVWASVEQFNEFAQTRLNPGVAQIGDFGPSQTKLLPVRAVFSPNHQIA